MVEGVVDIRGVAGGTGAGPVAGECIGSEDGAGAGARRACAASSGTSAYPLATHSARRRGKF